MENKRKHLEFIQAIISRMASNSFLLKGWCLTLVTALIALSLNDSNKCYILATYFPIVAFWVLDGYFLSQERLFRDLYDFVRSLDDETINFCMDTTPYKKKCRNKWLCSMLSNTLLIFYTPLISIMSTILFFVE